LTSLIDTITSFFEYIDIILRIHWHSLIKSDKILPLASIRTSNPAYRVRISRKKKKSLFERKVFFQLFNFMKWNRLRTSSFLASSVLMSILSLFRYCLSSFSSFSFFSFLSFSSFPFSFSFSSSFPAWDWISSMNSERRLHIHHLIRRSRLYQHAFESRK
jgi:hypothetical protein